MNKYILLFVTILGFSFQSNAQWELTNAVANLRAVDFVNDSTGLGITSTGDGRFILKTIDFGVNWDTVAIFPLTNILYDVVFADEQTAYACGQPNLFLKSIDGGEHWFDPTEGEDLNFIDILFVDSLIGYGTKGDGGGILASTTDGGNSWTILENGGGRDLHCTAACECFATVGNRVFRTEDCGQVWHCDTINFWNRDKFTIWAHDSNHYYLGCLGGFGTDYQFNFASIQKTTDGGNSFFTLDFPYAEKVIDLFFINETVGYAGCSPHFGQPYSILKTIDGGATWGYQEMEINPIFGVYGGIVEIDCPSPGYCYAVGGGVFRTTNGGGDIYEAWSILNSNETPLSQKKVSLYPNPATSIIHLELIDAREVKEIALYNGVGQRVAVFSGQERSIDVGDWPSGCYNVVVRYENEMIRSRFVVE